MQRQFINGNHGDGIWKFYRKSAFFFHSLPIFNAVIFGGPELILFNFDREVQVTQEL